MICRPLSWQVRQLEQEMTPSNEVFILTLTIVDDSDSSIDQWTCRFRPYPYDNTGDAES